MGPVGGWLEVQKWLSGQDLSPQQHRTVNMWLGEDFGLGAGLPIERLNTPEARQAFQSYQDQRDKKNSWGNLGDFVDTGWEGIKNLAGGVVDDPVRGLVGSFDPASTELWNTALGRDDQPLLSQGGGPGPEAIAEGGGHSNPWTMADYTAAVVGGGYGLDALFGGGAATTAEQGAWGGLGETGGGSVMPNGGWGAGEFAAADSAASALLPTAEQGAWGALGETGGGSVSPGGGWGAGEFAQGGGGLLSADQLMETGKGLLGGEQPPQGGGGMMPMAAQPKQYRSLAPQVQLQALRMKPNKTMADLAQMQSLIGGGLI
jgi:hypothetical protein